MAQPKLQAQFFASIDGIVIQKARPLNYDERMVIYRRDNGLCQSCGEKAKFGGNSVNPFQEVKSGHIDHIFPRARGGQNQDENLRLLCMTCNSSKGAK